MKRCMRKEFWSNAKVQVDEKYTTGFFKTTTHTRQVTKEIGRSGAYNLAQQFVDSLPEGALINICEYTRCESRIGDDGITVVAVWYWQEDNRSGI
jgi:hypothetical protein